MKIESLMQWFTQKLLPDVAKNGHFADHKESQTVEECQFEAIENYVNSFASAPSFAKLKLRGQSGTVILNILVKFQSQDPSCRERMRTVPQFKNEITVYNEVYKSFVEFLKDCGVSQDFIDKVIPKCYFTSNGNGDPEKAIVILEDLRKYGFKLSDSVTDLDLKHCFVAVERLARLHAISFAMKFRGWKPFEKLKTSFVKVWLDDVPICREQCEEFQGYVSNRGIDHLLAKKNSEVPKEYLENLRNMLKTIFELLKHVSAPKEPLAVIRHGDFNRNNTLYRYDSGEILDARLIDYQMVCYGSPSLDLGFLIYMNTNLSFREKHFGKIFEHYYNNLVKYISMISKESEKSIVERIPIQAFWEDFEKVAIWHYVIVSFFLPLMMTPPDVDFESDMKNLTFRQMAEKNYSKGGDIVSERISEVIIDFYRRKFYR